MGLNKRLLRLVWCHLRLVWCHLITYNPLRMCWYLIVMGLTKRLLMLGKRLRLTRRLIVKPSLTHHRVILNRSRLRTRTPHTTPGSSVLRCRMMHNILGPGITLIWLLIIEGRLMLHFLTYFTSSQVILVSEVLLEPVPSRHFFIICT